jgi:hypothetical protein
MLVSHRLHHRVLGLSLPHSLHSRIGHRRRRFSLPEVRRFTAPRLPRPRLRRLDVVGEDFPLVAHRRLAVRVPESCHHAKGRHRPWSRAGAVLCHGLRARVNAAREHTQHAGRGMGWRSAEPRRYPVQPGHSGPCMALSEQATGTVRMGHGQGIGRWP